jgi:hypothetical protein
MVIVILGIILFALLCVFSVISQCMRNARLAHYRDIQLAIEEEQDLERINGAIEPKETVSRAAGGYTTYVPVIP